MPLWQPKDFDHKYMGKIPLRKALTLSRNVPSVRIAQAVGIDSIIETARLAGITSKLDANLSLALGSSAVSPLELAGAYSTFARGGIAIHPQVIRKIENTRGQVIETFESRYDKAFDAEAVAELVSIMQDVVKIGTGTMARLADRPVAGKTGTADAGKDIWFAGFTPDLVAVVWGGNDENEAIPGHNVTGGTVMAGIWHMFMDSYYQSHPTPPGSFMEASRSKGAPSGKENGEGEHAADSLTSPKMPNLVPITPGQPPAENAENAGAGSEPPTTPANQSGTEPGMPPVAPNAVPQYGTQTAPSPGQAQ